MKDLGILFAKNADSSLVPLVKCITGETQTVDLSLVHQHQERAMVHFHVLPDRIGFRSLDKEEALAYRPCGALDLRNLPENPFGELRIRMRVLMRDDRSVEVFAWLDDQVLKQQTIRLKAAREPVTPKAPAYHHVRKKSPALEVPLARTAAVLFTTLSMVELLVAAGLWFAR